MSYESPEYLKEIRHYCSLINSRLRSYDIRSFNDKEKKEQSKLEWDRFQDFSSIKSDLTLLDIHMKREDFLDRKPPRMTDAEYVKKKRELRKVIRQEHKESEADSTLRMNTPSRIHADKAMYGIAFYCECTAENLRRGIYCGPCKLMLKVDDYMMRLFKDAAEGRSPSHSLVNQFNL
jgi:hypothetical protein